MAIELTSRLLAVIAVAAFTWILRTGRLPLIPTGRWTVVTVFGLGLAMCTVAGTRDAIGTTVIQPGWLTAAFVGLGVAGVTVLLLGLVGLNWRVAVAALGLIIGASWLAAFGYALYAGLDSAVSGAVTFVLSAGVAVAVWFFPHRSPGRSARAST
jgi:hypothetical protein